MANVIQAQVKTIGFRCSRMSTRVGHLRGVYLTGAHNRSRGVNLGLAVQCFSTTFDALDLITPGYEELDIIPTVRLREVRNRFVLDLSWQKIFIYKTTLIKWRRDMFKGQ